MRQPDGADASLRETLIRRRDIFLGRIIGVHVDEVRMPGGSIAEREVVDHPGAVAILPILDGGRIVLVRQYRHAAGAILMEVPAGKLDPGEAPAAAAVRELAEETGLRAGALTPCGHSYASPGVFGEVIHLFTAERCEVGPPSPDPDELVRAVELSRAEARALVDAGRVRDLKTLALLAMWLRR